MHEFLLNDLKVKWHLSVSSRWTWAFLSSLTFEYCNAGVTAMISASALAWTRQGLPSQELQRMHRLWGGSASSSMMPVGAYPGQ
jgi:hypothetical protein